MAAEGERQGGVWRQSAFLKLWTAQVGSLLGSQVTALAWPITAAVVLHATPTQMGIQSLCWTSAAVLSALLVGPWVDRLPRRPLMIGADLGRAALLASLPVAALAGVLSLGQLWAVVFLFSVLTVVFDVASMSFLPALVARVRLAEGNSALEASRSVVSVAGPAVAGPLVQVLTAPIALLVDAISYCFSAAVLHRIRVPEQMKARSEHRGSFWRDAGSGIGLVLRNPFLRPLAASSGTFLFFLQFFVALRIWYLTRELGIEAGVIGLIAAIGSVGGFGGALLAAKGARRFGSGPVMVGGLVLSGLGGLMVPLAGLAPTAVLAILSIGAVLDGLGGPAYNINALSLRQAITPDHLLGRTNAAMRFLPIAATPLGAILAGVMGGAIGVGAVLTIAAVGQAVAGLWVVASPVWTLTSSEGAVNIMRDEADA